MTADEVSAQLQADLRASVTEALSSRRPVLHHLNADSSWLLQIPRPKAEIKQGGRHHFNILIDPWLSGDQSDVASWFSTQTHATPSAVPTITAVDELLRNVEAATVDLRSGGTRRSTSKGQPDETTLIDAVAICHEFTDHCHRATLSEIPSYVPVYATDQAADLVRSWNHFDSVQKTPGFGGTSPDWRTTILSPLPEWLSISRIRTEGDSLYYHSALLFTFNNTDDLDGPAEAIIYSPHGIKAQDLECLRQSSPPVKTLVFLHGLHDVSLPGRQLNLGVHNGLKAQRIVQARYWIGTHDEVKKGGGVVSWFLRRKALTLQDALDEERQKSMMEADAAAERDPGLLKNANWVDLGNGESMLLA